MVLVSGESGKWHDEDFEWPQSIADHPYCDAGTTLMLYWMESPEFVHEQGSCDDSTEREIGHLDYIKSIESNYLHQQYRSARIKFDPKITMRSPKNLDKYKWIPCGMFLPTPGKALKTIKWNRDDDYNLVIH